MSSRLTAHLSKSGAINLTPLPVIEILSPLVTRILGGNPGPYTLQGTCTYLIGSGPRRLLLDTGDGLDIYLDHLKQAMALTQCSGLEGIVGSHWHHDHLGGIKQVQAVYGPGLPVYKYMPAELEEVFGGEGSRSVAEMWPLDQFTPIESGSVIRTSGATLVAHYAPGHANDLCVFELVEENALFSSDNVLGQGTGVARDLAQYLASLDLMHALQPGRLYPGHGPVVEDGVALIDEYRQHRLQRVDQVRHALTRAETPSVSLQQLLTLIYPELPESLKGPAMFNLLLALRYLEANKLCAQTDSGEWQSKI